jgi:MFS family permease
MPSFFARYPAPVWILFSGRVITSAGFSFGFPFFALYASTTLHESGFRIGAVILVSGLAGAAAKLVGGEWADRVGRKPVMQFALAGRCVTAAAIAAVIWKGAGFYPLAAALVTSNFFGQLFEPSSQAFVSDVTRGQVQVESFGLVRMGINLGWGLGLIAHGLLTQSYALAFLVTACVFAVSFALISLTIREPAHRISAAPERGAAFAFVANKPFLTLCAASALISVVWSQLVTSTSVYVTRHAALPEHDVPFILAVNGSLVFLLQLPASRLTERTGLVPALVAGCLFYAAGYGAFPWCSASWHFGAALAVVTAGEVLVAPSSTALAAQLAPDAERGRYLGLWGLASNAGFSLGPALGGWLLDRNPGRSLLTWLSMAAIGAAAAAAYCMLGLVLRAGRVAPADEGLAEVVARGAPDGQRVSVR